MKFREKVYWLSIGKDHKSYKPGYDPFYAEFELLDTEIRIVTLKFGDDQQTNLDKTWWFDLELNWMYEFED